MQKCGANLARGSTLTVSTLVAPAPQLPMEGPRFPHGAEWVSLGALGGLQGGGGVCVLIPDWRIEGGFGALVGLGPGSGRVCKNWIQSLAA